MQIPEPFAKRMKTILGADYAAFEAGMDAPVQCGLRVNRAKITTEEFLRITPFHLTPIPWTENGFYVEEGDVPSRHPHYFAGLYYLQEPSAMAPAEQLDVRPGERVLDLCAAPGGKSTELGAALRGEGLLVANDISAQRVRALLRNLELFGIPNTFLLNEVPAKIARTFPAYFDKILVDAPCSGEGMFRKNPEAVRQWSPEKPSACAKTQREILKEAVAMLKPGGKLLYATCTFAPEEDEQIAAWLLRQYPDLRLLAPKRREGFSEGLPLVADGNPSLSDCVRIWPHRAAGEGHFMALFQKEAGRETGEKEAKFTEKKRRQTAGSKAQRNVLSAFFADVRSARKEECLRVYGDHVYAVPDGVPENPGLVFVRNGLYLGEIRKDRFEPSQALAMALKKDDYASCVEFAAADERVLRYLRGESVPVEDGEGATRDGWQLVCVDGYPLGWGKRKEGMLKNKYPAGWRRC